MCCSPLQCPACLPAAAAAVQILVQLQAQYRRSGAETTSAVQLSKNYPKLSWLRPLGPISVCIIAILAVVIGKLDKEGNELIRTVQHVPQGTLLSPEPANTFIVPRLVKSAFLGFVRLIAAPMHRSNCAGLPSVTVNNWFPMDNFSKQLSTAFILFVVGFMESISISKALARKKGYDISVQQEIMAMGIANLFGAMFSSYATTGSFSRSAVAADIGAKRQLQGTITGVPLSRSPLRCTTCSMRPPVPRL